MISRRSSLIKLPPNITMSMMYNLINDRLLSEHPSISRATRVEMAYETLSSLALDQVIQYQTGMTIEDTIANILRVNDIVIDYSMNGDYVIVAHERTY